MRSATIFHAVIRLPSIAPKNEGAKTQDASPRNAIFCGRSDHASRECCAVNTSHKISGFGLNSKHLYAFIPRLYALIPSTYRNFTQPRMRMKTLLSWPPTRLRLFWSLLRSLMASFRLRGISLCTADISPIQKIWVGKEDNKNHRHPTPPLEPNFTCSKACSCVDVALTHYPRRCRLYGAIALLLLCFQHSNVLDQWGVRVARPANPFPPIYLLTLLFPRSTLTGRDAFLGLQ